MLATPVDEDEGRTEEEHAQQLAEAEEAEGGEAGTGASLAGCKLGLWQGCGTASRCGGSGRRRGRHRCAVGRGGGW